ncbi:MAG: hypothetical protein COB93_08385 [Sneathiella sp.]|nr:MAG: hypothetical protein COB93_08385 [Sneathiella sp.]
MKNFAALGLILALGIAGCGQTKTATGTADKAPKGTIVAVVPPLLKAEPTPPVAAVIKPRVLVEPTVVIGKSATEIRAAFGEPTLRRQDAPAEVWQYLATECALHLFFYPAADGDSLVVSHIAINSRSAALPSDIDRKQCFNDHLTAIGAEDAFTPKAAS